MEEEKTLNREVDDTATSNIGAVEIDDNATCRATMHICEQRPNKVIYKNDNGTLESYYSKDFISRFIDPDTNHTIAVCINYYDLTFGHPNGLLNAFGFLLADTNDYTCNELGFKLNSSDKVVVINSIIETVQVNTTYGGDYVYASSENIAKALQDFVDMKKDSIILLRMGYYQLSEKDPNSLGAAELDVDDIKYTAAVMRAIQSLKSTELTKIYGYEGSRVFIMRNSCLVANVMASYCDARYFYGFMDDDEILNRLRLVMKDRIKFICSMPEDGIGFARKVTPANVCAIIREAGRRQLGGLDHLHDTMDSLMMNLYSPDDNDRIDYIINHIIRGLYDTDEERRKNFKYAYAIWEKMKEAESSEESRMSVAAEKVNIDDIEATLPKQESMPH